MCNNDSDIKLAESQEGFKNIVHYETTSVDSFYIVSEQTEKGMHCRNREP